MYFSPCASGGLLVPAGLASTEAFSFPRPGWATRIASPSERSSTAVCETVHEIFPFSAVSLVVYNRSVPVRRPANLVTAHERADGARLAHQPHQHGPRSHTASHLAALRPGGAQ